MGAEVRERRHRGTFDMDEAADQCKPFTSDQTVLTRPPGLDWDGRLARLIAPRLELLWWPRRRTCGHAKQ